MDLPYGANSSIPNNNTASVSSSSSSVVLENIDDYLAPSQACVNPLFQPSTSTTTTTTTTTTDTTGGPASSTDPNNLSKSNELKNRTSDGNDVVVVPRRRRRIRKKVNLTTSPLSAGAGATVGGNDVGDITLPSSSSSSLANPSSSSSSSTTTKKDNSTVKASIADCLACSGCVTTAETVLLEQRHSLASLRRRLDVVDQNNNDHYPTTKHRHRHIRVITISPNSLADLYRHWKSRTATIASSTTTTTTSSSSDDMCPFNPLQLTTLLHQVLQATLVVDGNLPLIWTWSEEAEEFVQVYRQIQQQQQRRQQHVEKTHPTTSTDTKATGPSNSIPDSSVAVDATTTTYYRTKDGVPVSTETVRNANDPSNGPPSMPIVSGSCPALVCLVEKSIPALVPHLSQSSSPMSHLGIQLLNYHQQHHETKKVNDNDNIISTGNIGTTSKNWEHWAIMPCHDKKLEATRNDFLFPTMSMVESNGTTTTKTKTTKQHAVDLVITTQELVELIDEWITQQQQQREQSQTQMDVVSYLKSLPNADEVTINTPSHLFHLLAKTSSSSNEEEQQKPVWVTTESTSSLTTSTNDDNTTFSSSRPIEEEDTRMTMMNNIENSDIPKRIGGKEENNNNNDDDVNRKRMAYSSGGHADYIFKYAAKKLFNCTIDKVQWKATAVPTPPSSVSNNVKSDNNNATIGNNVTTVGEREKKRTVVKKSARLAKQQKQHYYQAELFQLVQDDDGSSYSQSRTNMKSSSSSSRLVLRFAIAHGMQTMQRALKLVNQQQQEQQQQQQPPRRNNIDDMSELPIHYLEAMACPHGCVNGGGSVVVTPTTGATTTRSSTKADQKEITTTTTTTGSVSASASTESSEKRQRRRETPSETKRRVQATVNSLTVPIMTTTINTDAATSTTTTVTTKDNDANSTGTSISTKTRYHIVPPMHYTMGATAGVKVQDMQW